MLSNKSLLGSLSSIIICDARYALENSFVDKDGKVANVGKILFDGSKFVNDGRFRSKGGGGGRKSKDTEEDGAKFREFRLGGGGRLFWLLYFDGLDNG